MTFTRLDGSCHLNPTMHTKTCTPHLQYRLHTRLIEKEMTWVQIKIEEFIHAVSLC